MPGQSKDQIAIHPQLSGQLKLAARALYTLPWATRVRWVPSKARTLGTMPDEPTDEEMELLQRAVKRAWYGVPEEEIETGYFWRVPG